METYIIHSKDMPVELIIEDKPTEIILSEKEKAGLSSSDILYELRVTFVESETPDLQEQISFTKQVIKELTRYCGEMWCYSIEHFKRGMVACKPHAHIRFLSAHPKERIRKQITRAFPSLIGNRRYCLTIVPDQTIKAFRYITKQQKNETFRHCTFTKLMTQYLQNTYNIIDIKQLRDEAYAVWLTACEVADKKEQKEEQATQLQERLFQYLDNQTEWTDLSIKVGIQKFYILEEKKPFNKTTALGYFYNYKITKNLMTHEELAKIW